MRKLLQVILTYYVFGLFLVLELIGFLMLVRYNTYHQISYLSWVHEITGGVNQRFSNLTEHLQLVTDNELLAQENAQLKQQLKQSYLKTENRFNPWVDTVYQQNYIYRNAKVIQNELSKQDNFLMINKGKLAGIRKGMGVINSTGVVGIVTDVSKHYSVVMSVLNSKFQLSVRLKRTGYFGTLNWNGQHLNEAILNDVQHFVEINKGDTIQTLGSSGIFPEGITTGVVSNYTPIPESSTWEINVQLSAELQQVKHVYVLENIFEKEILKLEENNQ